MKILIFLILIALNSEITFSESYNIEDIKEQQEFVKNCIMNYTNMGEIILNSSFSDDSLHEYEEVLVQVVGLPKALLKEYGNTNFIYLGFISSVKNNCFTISHNVYLNVDLGLSFIFCFIDDEWKLSRIKPISLFDFPKYDKLRWIKVIFDKIIQNNFSEIKYKIFDNDKLKKYRYDYYRDFNLTESDINNIQSIVKENYNGSFNFILINDVPDIIGGSYEFYQNLTIELSNKKLITFRFIYVEEIKEWIFYTFEIGK